MYITDGVIRSSRGKITEAEILTLLKKNGQEVLGLRGVIAQGVNDIVFPIVSKGK